MPPAISNPESVSDIDAPDTVPAKASKAKAAEPEEPEDKEEDGDEEDEDEYVVDRILEHGFENNGTVKYKVKWLGYEEEADMTWEPLENVEPALEKLQEYHNQIGGPPEPPLKKKKRGGKRSTEAMDSPAPASNKKRGRRSDANGSADEKTELVLPKGTWEGDVSHVMSIVEESEPDAKKPSKEVKTLMGFLQWNDRKKSKHPLKTLRTKCPQALLTYYENHLVFSKSEDIPDNLKTSE